MNKSAEYDWLKRVIKRYEEIGTLMPNIQRDLYECIGRDWCAGRTVVDLGSGLGIGSNILSHHARHVWGVDVNLNNVEFAKQAFSRPNLDFAVLDLEKPPSRGIAPFEVVVCIEVIEHLENFEIGLNTFKRFFSNKGVTTGFMTVPNINNPEIKERDAANELHLHRWTAGEFYDLLTKHFKSVTLYSADKLKNWDLDETVDGTSTDPLVLAKLEGIL